MKPIAFPVFVCLLLVACGTTPASPSPTSPPTSLPTLTETPPPSPTPTEDPLAGAPEGTTGKDQETGQWTKEKNGDTYFYTSIKSSDGKEHHVGWFKIAGEFHIMDFRGETKDIGLIRVYIEEGAAGGDSIRGLSHTEITTPSDPFIGLFLPKLMRRYGLNPRDESDERKREWQQLIANLGDGDTSTAVLKFIHSGTEYQWAPGPNTGTNVFILKWPGEGEAGFGSVWTDQNKGIEKFQTAFWGIDAEGNMLSAVSAQSAPSDKQLRQLLLYHTIQVLYREDTTLEGYDADVELYARQAEEGDPPYIQIQREDTTQ